MHREGFRETEGGLRGLNDKEVTRERRKVSAPPRKKGSPCMKVRGGTTGVNEGGEKMCCGEKKEPGGWGGGGDGLVVWDGQHFLWADAILS